jgi:hypothetical protein
MEYDPANWFWIVAGDPMRVYSSASQTYVAADSPAYVQWLKLRNKPRRVASEADLWDLLIEADVSVPGGVTPSNTSKTRQLAGIPRPVVLTLFNLWNRVRVLEGLPALTRVQFRSALRDLL